jgi:hypothetical protein
MLTSTYFRGNSDLAIAIFERTWASFGSEQDATTSIEGAFTF